MEITKCSCGRCWYSDTELEWIYCFTPPLYCPLCGDKLNSDGTVESHAELERDALAMRYIRDELIELQVNSFDEVDDEKWVAIRMKLGTDGNRKVCDDATAGTPQDAVFKAMER